MEAMDVAKDPAVRMKGEDLAHAYDAVRVANKSVCRPLSCTTSLRTFLFLVSCLICAKLSLSCPGFWRASCVASAVSRRRG